MTDHINDANNEVHQLLERHRATENAIFTMSVAADCFRSLKQLIGELDLMMAHPTPNSPELEGASWIAELYRTESNGTCTADEIRRQQEVTLTAANELKTAFELHRTALAEAGDIEEIIQQKRIAYDAACELGHVFSVDPEIRMGKPCIQGLRISPYDVLDYLGCGMSPEEILLDFPDLNKEHIGASLSFAGYMNRRLANTPAS